jgi:hypothetical protein
VTNRHHSHDNFLSTTNENIDLHEIGVRSSCLRRVWLCNPRDEVGRMSKPPCSLDATWLAWHRRAVSLAAAAWVATAALGLSEARGADGVRHVATSTQRSGPPPAGRYEGQLCVSTAQATENCGAVAVQFQSGAARVKVSDLVYHLQWRAPQTQMQLVLMHGSVQVDQFVTEGLWSKQTLRFKDPDKDVFYELRWKRP